MRRAWSAAAVLLRLLAPAGAQPAEAPPLDASPALAAIWAGGVPATIEELRAMEAHVQKLFARVMPAVVGIEGGSGVLIEGGWVLSAGHVTRRPGREVSLVLADGRRALARTLGADHRADAGLLRLVDDEELPAVPLGRSAEAGEGQWCIALGHARGWQHDRTPPLRLGRVVRAPVHGFLVTDCTIEAGDSGGPLFDMEGRVIGIHSRIAQGLSDNMHVPADAFHTVWDRLAAGEVIGEPPSRGAYLGIEHDRGVEALKVVRVLPGTAAERAGVMAGDVILRLQGRTVGGGDSLSRMLQRHRPGELVKLAVRRGEAEVELRVTLGRRED